MLRSVKKDLIALALTFSAGNVFAQAPLPAPSAASTAVVTSPDASAAAANAPLSADPVANASPEQQLRKRKSALERQIEERGSTVVRRFVPESEFNLHADVQLAPNQDAPIPYLPNTQSTEAFAMLAVDQMHDATTRVTVNLALAKRYSEKTRVNLAQILTRTLGLDPTRGDSVKIDLLDLDLPPQHSDIEISLMRAEAERLQERQRADQDRKERDALKLEIVAAKSAIDQLAREKLEVIAAQKKVDPPKPVVVPKPEPPVKIPEAPKDPTWVTRAKDFGVPAASALALLACAFLVASAFRGIGRGLVDGASSMSKAIEATANVSAPPQDITLQQNNDNNAARAGSIDPARSTATLETLKAAVLDLHQELLQHFDVENQDCVLEYLSSLLEHDENASKAVAAMELLGTKHANALFRQLSVADQSAVLVFIRDGHYKRPKLELMLEAGEELKTRIFGTGFEDGASTKDAALNALVRTCTPDELAQAVMKLKDRTAARLLFYLDPARMAPIVASVGKTAPRQVDRFADLLLKMPDIVLDRTLDADIQTTLQQLTAKNDHTFKPYLKLYSDLLNATDESLRDTLRTKLMRQPTVARFLSQHTVTFEMLFALPTDLRDDIIAKLSVKDVAALYSGLESDEFKQALVTNLPERRREIMLEEAQQIVRRGSRQIQAAYKAARQSVSGHLMGLQRSGLLEVNEVTAAAGLPPVEPPNDLPSAA